MTLLERRTRKKRFWEDWWVEEHRVDLPKSTFLLNPIKLKSLSSSVRKDLIFTNLVNHGEAVYTHMTHTIHSMPETVAHRILRSSKCSSNQLVKIPRVPSTSKNEAAIEETRVPLLPEHPHRPRPPITRNFQRTVFPAFLYDNIPKVRASKSSCKKFHGKT